MNKIYNIVYCVPNLAATGGMEKIIITKANYFADNLNYNITLLISDLKDKSIPFYISPKVEVINLSINNYTSSKVKGVSFLKNLKKLRRVYTEQLVKIKPDIIIVPERGYEDFFIPSICKNIPKVREYHFSRKASNILEKELTFKERLKSRFIKNLYFKQFKRYDAFVVLTEQDKKEWSRIKNKYVIPNYLNPVNISQKPLHERPLKAISVGSMHNDRKGFSSLIKIWKQLKQHHDKWTLHIYGDGPYKNTLQDLIKKEGLQKSIFLEGNTTKIHEKYQESQLFLFASKGEGLPMVLLESQQHGLPLIAYDCYCGPSDILTKNNKGGFLVDMHNENAFIKYSNDLMKDKELRKNKSREAYSNIKRFEENAVIPLWVSLFNTITSKTC